MTINRRSFFRVLGRAAATVAGVVIGVGAIKANIPVARLPPMDPLHKAAEINTIAWRAHHKAMIVHPGWQMNLLKTMAKPSPVYK